MKSLKESIFEEIRKSNMEFALLEDNELDRLVFRHPDSIRLTLTGFNIVRKIFTAYSFSISEKIKTKHFYGMSKMEYPYFLTRKRLILFSEIDAAVVKLHGGIENFLENYSQL